VQPTIIHVRTSGSDSSGDLRKEIVENLVMKHGFIDLNVNDLIRDESERLTELGTEFLAMVSAGKVISADMIVKMLRRNIYSGHDERIKYLLTGFPDVIEQVKEFEDNCAEITAIIYASADGTKVEVKSQNLQNFNIDSLF